MWTESNLRTPLWPAPCPMFKLILQIFSGKGEEEPGRKRERWTVLQKREMWGKFLRESSTDLLLCGDHNPTRPFPTIRAQPPDLSKNIVKTSSAVVGDVLENVRLAGEEEEGAFSTRSRVSQSASQPRISAAPTVVANGGVWLWLRLGMTRRGRWKAQRDICPEPPPLNTMGSTQSHYCTSSHHHHTQLSECVKRTLVNSSRQ